MVANRLCRRDDQLRLFLDNRLTADQQTALVRHLDTCVACQTRLESLTAEADEWNELRSALSAGAADVECEGPGPAAAAEMPPGTSGEPPVPLDFLAPTDDPEMLGRLGTYEVAGVIGYGGMGIVLKAFDRALSRNVAIKVLAPQLAISASARRRFAREARAAAAVVHEHVVPIHAVAEAGGLPYLVMAYVPGSSLQRRIDRGGPLAVPEILRIAMQTASGLAAAHAQGLVHRDIKPANILLEDGVERVMITDFGLARTVDDASLTRSGVIAGTPRYMAPEQATGDGVDHRADLFSLGSVMYVMCTGRPPFRAETALAVMRRICEEQPRPIRQINPEIPDWLVEIVQRLHEKDPAARFQTAAEVAELLGQHLAHLQQPGTVPRPPRLARRRLPAPAGSGSPWRRTLAVMLLMSIVGAGLIGLVAGGYFGGLFSAASNPPEDRSPKPAVATGGIYYGPSEQQWDEEVARMRQRIDRIESGWHQGSDSAPVDAWPESISELDLRVEELEHELNDQEM